MSVSEHNKYAAVLAGVATAAALLMVLLFFQFQTLVLNTGDPYDYGNIARGFVEHGFTKLTRRAASLYPELIAVVYRAGGSDHVIILLQCLFHAATCVLVFRIALRIFNARTGLLAGLFCAFHPMLLRYVPDLHMESFLTLMCTLTIWTTVRFYDRPTVVNGILVGVVGMCTTLTKGVMLPYLGVFGILCGVIALKQRSTQRVAAVVAMFVAMAVVLAPWTYRNYQVTGGRFVLLTPGAADSFLRGYVFTRWEFATLQKPPFTDAENEVNDWFRKIARDAGTVWEKDEVVDEQNNARVAKRSDRDSAARHVPKGVRRPVHILVRNDQLEELADTRPFGADRLGTRDRRPDQGKSRRAAVLVDLASDRGDERLCCTLDSRSDAIRCR